jgi:DNA-binding IclR family transcriptional regulator
MVVTRPAPSASRALAILDFLAAHPTESFTLSELARQLGINVASAHAVLGAMTDAGYLVRHASRRTYRLGPSTMAIGHAALASHPVIGVAREQMQRLADETGLECLASAPFEMEMVAVARIGPTSGRAPLIQVGQRLPLIPPLGTMYVAWSSHERIDEWLRRAPDQAKATIRHYRNVLESARNLGYSVGISVNGQQVALEPVSGQPDVLNLGGADRRRVSYIAASTFDERGEVSLVISFGGFDDPLTAEQIEGYAHRLHRAAVMITAAVHGSPPASAARPR